MWQFAKRLVFGRGPRPHKIRFGIGAGCRFVIDPASKTQRIMGLDEAEVAKIFRRNVANALTFIDVGASDGYYPIIALWLNAALTAIGCDPQPGREQQARENYRLNFPDGGPALEWVPQLVGCGEGQVSLDQIAEGRPGPFFVKIDVDGAEVEVLRSGPRLLARSDCRVLVEVHSPELEANAIKLLQAQQFSCQIVKNAWWRSVIPEHRPIELNRWVFAEHTPASQARPSAVSTSNS